MQVNSHEPNFLHLTRASALQSSAQLKWLLPRNEAASNIPANQLHLPNMVSASWLRIISLGGLEPFRSVGKYFQ